SSPQTASRHHPHPLGPALPRESAPVHPCKPCKRRETFPPCPSHVFPPQTQVDPEPQPPLATSQALLFLSPHFIPHPASLPVALLTDARCTDIPARTSAGTEGTAAAD